MRRKSFLCREHGMETLKPLRGEQDGWSRGKWCRPNGQQSQTGGQGSIMLQEGQSQTKSEVTRITLCGCFPGWVRILENTLVRPHAAFERVHFSFLHSLAAPSQPPLLAPPHSLSCLFTFTSLMISPRLVASNNTGTSTVTKPTSLACTSPLHSKLRFPTTCLTSLLGCLLYISKASQAMTPSS